jgi:hypothetical protein
MIGPLFLLVATALADTPAYRFTAGEKVRYYMDSELYWGAGIKATARENLSTRIQGIRMRAEVECEAKPFGKSTELKCTLPWLRLTADPQNDSQERVDRVMADWLDYTRPVRVSVVVAPDGKLREFDVNGLPDGNLREGQLASQMRSFLRAMFAPLDVTLPTDPKDWIRGWKRTDLGFMTQLPTGTGTAGAGTVKHSHVDDRLGLVLVDVTGRATVAPGGAVESSANGGLVDLRLGGEAWIDPAAGQLLFSGFSTDGRFVASASGAGNGQYIAQRAAVQRVAEFEPEHGEPISVVAQRAPRRADPPHAADPAAPIVDFASLGMKPLFITGLPEIAVPYELPKSTVKARVVVGADGVPTAQRAFEGYELLFEHVERALRDARFPAREGAYSVDVAVEVVPA